MLLKRKTNISTFPALAAALLVSAMDIGASSGVMHVVDTVSLPN
jgi:hypothetical protein